MAKSNNAIMLALVGGGAYLAYKSGIFKGVAGTGTGATPTSTGTIAATSSSVSNANVAPAATDNGPAPNRSPSDPRGIRNNNPGNIVFNAANAWAGQVGSDGTFSKFDGMWSGIRAMIVLLRNYCKLYNLCTISQIAGRWAPAPANNPTTYANTISSVSGIGVNATLDLNDYATVARIVRGIAVAENGMVALSVIGDNEIRWGFDNA